MFLSKEDFNTHLYPEIIDTISREDDLILDDAIEAAIGEAESYLGRFDTDALFEATDDDRDKTLLLYVKDITVWHFIAVCNADTDIDMRESRYNKAINWLKNIQFEMAGHSSSSNGNINSKKALRWRKFFSY